MKRTEMGCCLKYALPLVLASCGSQTGPDKRLGQVEQPIYGGTTATPDDAYDLVAIVNETTDPSGGIIQSIVCTGTVIDAWHVLTAAHCVTAQVGASRAPSENYKVLIANAVVNSTINGIGIDAIYRHPDYRTGTANAPGTDIAILRMSQPTTRTPVVLPTSGLSAGLTNGSTVRAVGYGVQETGAVGAAQGVDLMYYGQGSACLPYDDGYPSGDPRADSLSDIAATELCVGRPSGGTTAQGTCFGDSGGPVFFNDGTQTVQIGITSHGAPRTTCGDEVPDVYTSVADNIGFINSVLNSSIRADLNGDGMDESTLMVSEGSPNYELLVMYDAGQEPSGVGPTLRIDTGIPILHGKEAGPDYLASVSVFDEDGDARDDVRVEIGGLRADYRGLELHDDYWTTFLSWNGLPSASSLDGRFLTLATRGLETVDRPYARFYVVSKYPSTYIGLFDPDISGLYDKIVAGVKTCVKVYADPQANGPDDDVDNLGNPRPPIGTRQFLAGQGEADWFHVDGDPSTPEINPFTGDETSYAYNGSTWSYRVEVFLAPETTGDGHDACDDPPETQSVPDQMFNSFKIHANGELRVSDVDLSFLAVDSMGDYRGNHSVSDILWTDTTYQGYFNFPFYVGANTNWATFRNADADDQDHPSPAKAIGKNHEVHSRIYAYRQRAHSFFPASEYPSETAKGRPSGGYDSTGTYENGDYEELGLSLYEFGDLPESDPGQTHNPTYGNWLWQDIHDSNIVHIWVVRGSPQHLDFTVGGSHNRVSAARTSTEWSGSPLASYLPMTLGRLGASTVVLRTEAEANALLNTAGTPIVELQKQLFTLKLNVNRAAQRGELLETGLLYGKTTRIRDLLESAEDIVADATGVSTEDILDLTTKLSSVNSGQVTYVALPTDEVGASDPDGDGVMANLDNCPLVANASQADADGNGIGDDCEPMPFVQCVVNQGNGSYRAVFGYDNEHTDRRISVGANNQFSPGPADRGQPPVQYLGGEERAVTGTFTTSLTWSLAGHSATATPSSPACPASDVFDPSFASNVVAYGDNEVQLGDNVSVPGDTTVANGGTGVLEVGAHAQVNNLLSEGDILLRSGAQAFGQVIAAGDFSAQAGAETLNGFTEGGDPGVPPLAFAAPTWPSTTGNVQLEPGQVDSIAASSKGLVSVKAGAQLTLTAGEFYFDELQLETGSTLIIDDSSGPIAVHVQSDLTIRGNVVTPASSETRLAFIYYGSNAAFIETSLTAAVAAPNASLNLGGQGLQFTGQFFARTLTVYPNIVLSYLPLADLPDPVVPVCGDGSVQPGETCDDGNVVSGDGCDDQCQTEVVPGCSEATATDLGSPGTQRTVPSNACLRVLDGYPGWWGTRNLGLQPISGSFPVPFTWSNACQGSGGSASFNAAWATVSFGLTNAACATLIQLEGSGSSNVTLTYYGY
jgi:cysteine-rich repeat protein